MWTNPAVHVNDQYQSVFPPDVQAVFDHGKRDVSAFPIAHGEYYKVDYSHGVDISWYKNLPVPTSYMAASSTYDFLGGYDHGRQAVVHRAQRVEPAVGKLAHCVASAGNNNVRLAVLYPVRSVADRR